MRALLLDTETTGLIQNRSLSLDLQPEVIEFYGLLVDLDKPRAKSVVLHHMIKPSRPFPERAEVVNGKRGRKTITDITGITNAMLAKCPTFKKVHAEIFGQIEAAPLVIAQNVSFDRDVLDVEADRLGVKIRWPTVLCTIEQSVHYTGERLNLNNLHEHLLGVRFEGAHRAEADVQALLRCCVEMRRRGDL